MAAKMMEENKAILGYIFNQFLNGETNKSVNLLNPENPEDQAPKRRKMNGLLF